jgi:hypothetical protein
MMQQRIVQIRETVLVYKKTQLKSWRAGDKSLVSEFMTVPLAYVNQPTYHFGEAFALRHYHEAEWKGHSFFSLARQADTGAFKQGNDAVERIVPAGDLSRLRTLRAADPLTKHHAGEPDLFLYRETGQFMFAEVKKQSDYLRPSQRRSIEQILAVLGCPVDIVYLRGARQRYTPKTYEFDLMLID